MTATSSPPQRLPTWIRKSLKTDHHFSDVSGLISTFKLNTVCESAKCPNRHECWNSGTATIMILGDICTRDCKFCAIKTGRPEGLDRAEPGRVAAAAASMDLRHVVVTSVARDDLEDGGAGIFADTVTALKERLPDASVEVLTSDFGGAPQSVRTVLDAGPDVFNHNIECVPRFQSIVRPQASYGRSLAALQEAARRTPAVAVKSGLILGFGETRDEVVQTLEELHGIGCRMLTLCQYLRPSREHLDVARYVTPEEFEEYDRMARDIGFRAVASGPMVRPSYRADVLLEEYRRAEGLA